MINADGISRSTRWIDAVIIALAVAAMRVVVLGNPHVHVDEEFYLLMGGRMLDGALPYVDIWDRKPLGLFLIYAVAALFGDGVLAYQLIALLFVFATSMIVHHIARSYAGRYGAVTAAIAYPALLNLFEGMGGQAPVYYNLPVTAAAALIMHVFTERDNVTTRRFLWLGAAAMLLVGLAIQIKTSVLGEGLCFGLFLMRLMWRRKGVAEALGAGALWAFVALLPTLLVLIFYASLGYADIFIHANYTSVGARGHDPDEWVIFRFKAILRIFAVPVLFGLGAAAFSAWRRTGVAFGDTQRFVLLWNGAAWLSFLAFGTYFPHYALPLAAPASLILAFATGFWWRWAQTAIVAWLAFTGVEMVAQDLRSAGGAPVIREMIAAMGRPRNCPYFYEGSPILYHLSHSCLPTRYAFPYHLTIMREHDALGIDADAELARILSRNPEFIVVRLPFSPEHSAHSNAMVVRTLKMRYRIVMANRQWGIYDVVLLRLRPEFTPLPNDARDFRYPRPGQLPTSARMHK
ncbi:MAG: hypothetical protein ABW184_15150 [Sphingobium sp.]